MGAIAAVPKGYEVPAPHVVPSCYSCFKPGYSRSASCAL